jgi:hypothetical protein
MNAIKRKLFDVVLSWLLESKISPIGWLNGYKTVIGNILTAISGVLLIIEQSFCPGPEWCAYVAGGQALIAFLLSLIVKLVGEWHAVKKELR